MDGPCTDGIVRKRGDENTLLSEQGKGYGDIGLAASESGLKRGRLEKPLVPRGFEAQHDLAERNNFIHKLLLILHGFCVYCIL